MDFNQIPAEALFTAAHTGEQYARIALAEREQVSRYAEAFCVFDKKGREIGHMYTIDRECHTIDSNSTSLGELSALDLMLGESFMVRPQSLRDGKWFGATPVRSCKRFKTLDEAIAYGDRCISRADRAALKKASA